MRNWNFVTSLLTASVINRLVESSKNETAFGDGKTLLLTEYIENQQLELAKNLSLVKHTDMEWLTSYSGYFTVHKQYNSNMFFWFFPAKIDSKNAPVVLWLQGGPGASSLYGLFMENGPIFLNSEEKLQSREYSWHIDHNLLYIDNPVGSGFSFTENDSGYATNMIDVGVNLLNAVNQFFALFPEFKENEFYAAGQSYAGKYIPAIGMAILQHNNHLNRTDKINLQGLIIGNGWIDPINQLNYGEYLYHLGLIDDAGRILFEKHQKNAIDCIHKQDFEGAFYHSDRLLTNMFHEYSSLFRNLTGLATSSNFIQSKKTSLTEIHNLFSQNDFKEAIHVGSREFKDVYTTSTVKIKLIRDIMQSVSEWVAELLNHYEVYLYSGQLDIIVNYPSTVKFVQNLKFNGSDKYKTAERHILRVDNEVFGYVKQAVNLTEVLVRNAGHSVPTDQPKLMLNMLKKITFGAGSSSSKSSFTMLLMLLYIAHIYC